MPVWRTTPGAMIDPVTQAVPPITALRPRIGIQPRMRVDAVLLRDNRGLGPDDRPDRLAGGLDIPQLDTEDHVIDDADVGRITTISPRSPSILRPFACIAARCAPRATKMTSTPALASEAP